MGKLQFVIVFALLCLNGVRGGVTPANSFLVFLDLGSSGTKLKVYKWSNQNNIRALPDIELIDSKKFKPGLSTFANDLNNVHDYVLPIITRAKTLVNEEQWAKTPIFAMATAGLRFLEADTSMALMDKFREVLRDSTVSPFVYDKADVQILSGEEEGVYAWVALNYLLGKFDTTSHAENTSGILEMGGGSTQIAFIPKEPLYAGEFQVELLHQIYELYAHSYLDYGLNAVEERLASYLNKKGKNKNPCLLTDDTKTYNIGDRTVTQAGSGKPRKCYRFFQVMMMSAVGDACEPKPCAIGNVYQPHVRDVPFYATQGFTYTPTDLEAVDSNSLLNVTDLRLKGVEYCKKTLSEAVASGASSKYASGTCLQSQYFPVLLSQAYKIEEQSKIIVTSEVNGEGIDWALGAVLVELSRKLDISAEVRRRR